MADPFANLTPGLESPASHIAAVVPSDTEDLTLVSRGLNVATSGTVRVTTVSDETATVFLAAGSAFPIRVKRIWATGTTATGIVVMC